jgi:hypothetical protein
MWWYWKESNRDVPAPGLASIKAKKAFANMYWQ